MTTPLNFTKQCRVMVIAPHPDDETLATGGLLQQAVAAGAAVRVIFATSGDNNPWPQRIIERRWGIGDADRVRWGARRRSEALAALSCLGIPASSTVFLSYTDQGITEILLTRGEGPILRLATEITNWHPTLLVAPSALDIHPDHSALAVLLRFSLSRLGHKHPPFREISYLIHTRQPELFNNNLIYLRLLPEQQTRKREAILCHATQLKLSRRRFLSFAGNSEKFIPITEPGNSNDYHPVRHAIVTDTTLQLKIVMHSCIDAFGRTTLYMAIDNSKRTGTRCFMALPRKSSEVDVCDVISGIVITRAFFCGNRRQGEILLPLSAFLPMKGIFIKLKRRFGFLDEAGWREIPVSHTLVSTVPALSKCRTESPSAQKVCCVIPCYNVASRCAEIVREAALYANQIIAVNDGSTDETDEVLRKVEAESNGRVRVLSFVNNCGKGVALLKGFSYAIEKLTFDILVTLDADGQHCPADIPRLVRCIQEDEHTVLVIGERNTRFTTVPLRSRLGNMIITTLLRWIYPCSPRDTQSGLRAFKRSFVEEIICNIKGGRYETELYILMLALEQRQRIATVPVPTIYLNKNKSSHFRPIIDSLRVCRAVFQFRTKIRKRLVTNRSINHRGH